MISKKYVYLIILISFNIISYANNKIIGLEKDSIIARIGNDYEISFKDLSRYVTDWRYNLKYRDKSEGYKLALNDLIVNQLKRFDFFDRGLHKNEKVVRNLRRTINEELTVEFFDNQFASRYSTEKDAAEAYKTMDKEVICSQIVVPIKGDEKENELDSLKRLAETIKKDLVKSKDLKNILRKYSKVNLTNLDENRRISWEQSVKNYVAGDIYNLKKGDTKIIRAIDGYYIVKVNRINKVKVEPFEKIKNDIITKLKEGNVEKVQNEFEDYKNGHIDAKTVKWNKESIKIIKDWSNIPNFYFSAYTDTIQYYLNSGRNFEIMSYNNGRIDLEEYLRLLEEVVIMNPEEAVDTSHIKTFILEAVLSDFIVKEARGLDLEKKFLNPYTNNFLLKHRITLLYNQAVIDAAIPEATETALQKFYDEQKDSALYQLAKVNIYVRIYSDSIQAADEISKINAGTTFEEISNRWLTKSFVRGRDGKLNSYLSTEPPYLAEAAFRMKENEVAGPVMYLDNEKGKQFAVIKCSAVRPAKRPTYAELKNSIKDEFNKYYKQKLSDEVEKQLRNKYKVEIFDNYLSELLSSVK